MVCVGIDVAKDKHDCCILDSDGTVRADCFTIPNNMDGFKKLLQTIQDCTQKTEKIKVGLEATGHYSYNILGFLLDNGLPTCVINPLHTNLYRKSLSLRKTKADRTEKTKLSRFEMQPELPLDPLCLLNLWNRSIPLNSFGKLPPRLMKSKFLFSFEIACGLYSRQE